MVGVEENGAKVGLGQLAWIRLEAQPNVDNEDGTDCRDKACLRARSTLWVDEWNVAAHENQNSVKILVVSVRASGIVVFCWLEVHS